jgi:hypothetical protein
LNYILLIKEKYIIKGKLTTRLVLRFVLKKLYNMVENNKPSNTLKKVSNISSLKSKEIKLLIVFPKK